MSIDKAVGDTTSGEDGPLALKVYDAAARLTETPADARVAVHEALSDSEDMLGVVVPREVEVGISDLLADRDCPRRAAYGARRHTERGMQNQAAMTPEAGSPAASYGSCLHDAIEHSENGWSDIEAIEVAWSKWGHDLGPEDVTQLHEDIAVYHTRDFKNVRTVLSEGEIRVFLCVLPDGRRCFFRGRIDRLYERLDRPGSFILVDYKTSKWQKSQEEVDQDPQQWSYNWGAHEFFPEIEELDQCYDQFRHGQVFTRKTDAQREEIREWLILQAHEYFKDKPLMADGLPAPRFNMWCAYCSHLMDCPIVPKLSDWALGRIKILGGELPAEIDAAVTPIDTYVDQFDSVQSAIRALTAFEEGVKTLAKQLPEQERDRLRFRLSERKNTVYDQESLEAMHNRLGPQFFELVKASKGRLEKIEDEQVRDWALSLGVQVPGPKVVTRRK